MLHQLHWQYKDGTTEFRTQKDINSHQEMRTWFEDIKESHPLPDNAVWLFVPEKSKHFMLTEVK